MTEIRHGRVAALFLAALGTLLFVALAVQDCDAEERKPAGMKAALTFMAIGQTADLVTTIDALNRGAVEGNPIWGRHPSAKKLILGKAPMIGLGYVLHKVGPKNPKFAKTIAYSIGALGAGLAIHNARVSRGRQ